MAKSNTKPRPSEDEKSQQNGQSRRIVKFKPASELPPSIPDYVVLSPTPLGLRPVPQVNKQK